MRSEVEELGIDPCGDGCGADGFALVRLDADGATILDKDLGAPASKPDVHAVRCGGLRHGLGDRTHAADGVAPDAFLAVHLAKAMMQQNIGRARRVGARIIADDAVEAEGSLDRRAFEPAVEEVAGGCREQIEQGLAAGRVRGLEFCCASRPGLISSAMAASGVALDNIRRRFEHDGAQDIGDGRQARLIVVETIRIPHGEFRDLAFRVAAADLQEAPVIQGQEVGDRTLDDAQSMGVRDRGPRMTFGFSRETV